jgi:hypothetical protein
VSNPPDCADSRASLLLALTAQHGQAFPTAVSDRVSGVPRLSRSEPAALKSAVEQRRGLYKRAGDLQSALTLEAVQPAGTLDHVLSAVFPLEPIHE